MWTLFTENQVLGISHLVGNWDFLVMHVALNLLFNWEIGRVHMGTVRHHWELKLCPEAWSHRLPAFCLLAFALKPLISSCSGFLLKLVLRFVFSFLQVWVRWCFKWLQPQTANITMVWRKLIFQPNMLRWVVFWSELCVYALFEG